MRHFIFSFFFISTLAYGQDLQIYTRTEAPWNLFLLDKVQQVFKNIGSKKEFNTYVYQNEEIRYENSTIEEFLTPSSNDFLTRIEDISGLKILDIKPELSLQNIGYRLHNFNPDIRVEQQNDKMIFHFEVGINGLDITADSIDLDFILSQLVVDEKITALEVKILKPEVLFDSSLNLSFSTSIELLKKEDGFEMTVKEIDTSKMVQQLTQNMELFQIGFEDFFISDVRLELFGRVVTVQEERIKQTIRENTNQLKQIIVEQLAKLIEKDGLRGILDSLKQIDFTDEMWINTGVGKQAPMSLEVLNLRKVDEQILAVDLLGEFCTERTYVEYEKECAEMAPFDIQKFDRSHEEKKSVDEIIKQHFNDQAQMIVALDENYLTKLVTALELEGILDGVKEELKIELGDKGALVRMDSRGDRIDLYLDVLYDVGFMQGVLLTKRKLRFPIHLMIEPYVKDIVTDFTDDEGILHEDVLLPHLVFRIKDVDIEHRILRYGIPEYNLPSTLDRVTFGLRGVVVGKVQKELLKFDHETQSLDHEYWEGVELPPILVPELYKLDLDKVRFESTGAGKGLFLFHEVN